MTVLDTRWRKDRSWWEVDEDFKIHLTESAPQEAVESFKIYQDLGHDHKIVIFCHIVSLLL